MIYTTSGLKPVELLGLTENGIDMESRMIIPSVHKGATKRSWIAFFNTETETLMKPYLPTRKVRGEALPKGKP